MSYGISASYAINKKLSIRSGINRVNLGYNTNNVVVFQSVGLSSSSTLQNVSVGNTSSAADAFSNGSSETISVISGEISQGSIKSGGMAMQYLDTTKYLPSIKNQCLIILASEDVVVSKQKSELLIKDIPHASIIELSNVGHAPYCEDAISYNNVLVKFLL